MAAGGDRTEFVGPERFPVSLSSLQTRTGSDVPPGENSNEAVTSGGIFSGGNEREDENSVNVARWLASLPKDRHWCEAEEQIACMEDHERTNLNDSMLLAGDGEFFAIEAASSIVRINDADKSIQHRRGKPRVANDARTAISIAETTIERRNVFPSSKSFVLS